LDSTTLPAVAAAVGDGLSDGLPVAKNTAIADIAAGEIDEDTGNGEGETPVVC
jgi:hypothetical protein